ncbi:MAG: type I methionyl aminopeptidase [Bacteroidetes bacterium]|nr:type I methionyl aminopeptidase [Bacteroidota bacterium]
MAIIIKTKEQIEGIRKSCVLARNTLKHIAQFIEAGVTTEFIDKKAGEYISSHGGIPATLNYKGYKHGSCISVNDVVCHGIPNSKTILKDGDIVNVDIATILNGFFGDTCLMYEVGTVGERAKKLLRITRECLDVGIKECKPGNKFGNIGFAIAGVAKRHGYSVVYQFCGHGVGLKFHEDPEVNHIDERNAGPVMKPGMTFTIEPMINEGKARVKIDKHDKWTARTIDGKLSAQYEHTILITESGAEVLTDVDEEYQKT